MLETLRRGRRWGTAAVVVLVGGVFVVFIGLSGPLQCTSTGANVVVQVGDRPFYRDDFQRTLYEQEQYLRDQLGAGFDARQAEEWLQNTAASVIVSQAILAAEAEQMGLGVGRDELKRRVLADPGFRDAAGEFDRELYKRYVSYEYGNEAGFLEATRTRFLAQKMARLLSGSAYVSEAEARDAVLYGSQEIKLAWIAFDEKEVADRMEVSEDEIASFAGAHPDRIQARYDERLEDFEQDEAVHARHILIELARDADEATVEKAQGDAVAALTRVREGEDFAAVAAEVSGDSGSKDRGGDLGFFTRGQMTPPFEEAAFAGQPGELIGPVRSDFGFHVIRIEARREAGVRTLDDVRLELARELLAEEKSRSRAHEVTEDLAQAIEAGLTLEEAVRQAGLTVERTGWIARRPDGFIPGLGASLPIQDAAFSLSLERPGTSQVFEVQGKQALIQLLERREPGADELATRVAQEQERLLEQRRAQAVNEWIDSRRRQLAAEGRLFINLDALNASS